MALRIGCRKRNRRHRQDDLRIAVHRGETSEETVEGGADLADAEVDKFELFRIKIADIAARADREYRSVLARAPGLSQAQREYECIQRFEQGSHRREMGVSVAQ